MSSALVGTDPAYERTGVTVVRQLIDPDEVRLLATYFQIVRDSGSMDVDPQVPGSISTYAAAGSEALLSMVASPLSSIVGRRLLPTYSFARFYNAGQELVAHRDRPECEHSATVHLASSDAVDWPIQLLDRHGDNIVVTLRPGDAVLYRGDELLHWRDPLPQGWYLQVFLHYVDASGPFADRVLDRRDGLGRVRRSVS